MSRRTMPALLAASAILAVPVAAGAQPYQHVPRPTASGKGGAVATADGVATDAAIRVLRRGGNAVDAAIAAAAVLGVTEPFSCGIGGGGFMVIRRPNGRVTTIDSREKAPAAMHPRSFFENGRALSFDDARYSGLSGGVPGTVAGWRKAMRRFGTWRMRRVLRPAIRVAREGFVIDKTFHDQAQDNAAYFDDITTTEALYLDPDGTARDVGTVQRNPDLARTYRRIGRLGNRGFYAGPVAEALVDAVRRPPLTSDADHTWRPGLMTLEDLDRYTAPWRRPARVSYRGLDVYGMRAPSSGGSTVGETLNILEGVQNWDALPRTQKYHWFLEASRFAFADRGRWLADPAFYAVPMRGLLSQSFGDERRALIDPARAQPGAVPAGNPLNNAGASRAPRASVTSEPLRSTTHLTVADRRGMVVSYTFTIESTGGNGIVVPGWGFLVNNELTDFDFTTTDPDTANKPEGGKRPRSSMAPTIVQRRGRMRFAVGSPGGSTIITTVAQILMERIDLGSTLPQAIATPRAAQRNGATTQAEPPFIASPDGQVLAAQYGHRFVTPTLTPPTNGEIGAATGIEFRRGGRMLAAAEPARRGGGAAKVVRRR
jgi:gamma-glutamyltranspeptidase / glutathione hydrolase